MGANRVESPVQESLRTQLHRVVSSADDDTWSLPAAPVDAKSTEAALRPTAVPAAAHGLGCGCGVWIASQTAAVTWLGLGLGRRLGLGFRLGFGLHIYTTAC